MGNSLFVGETHVEKEELLREGQLFRSIDLASQEHVNFYKYKGKNYAIIDNNMVIELAESEEEICSWEQEQLENNF